MKGNRLPRWTFRLGVAVCVVVVAATVVGFRPATHAFDVISWNAE